jgi:hypothetical protein
MRSSEGTRAQRLGEELPEQASSRGEGMPSARMLASPHAELARTLVGAFVDALLVSAFVPPAVVCNEWGDIVHAHGPVSRFLGFEARAGANLFRVRRADLRDALLATIGAATPSRRKITRSGLRFSDDDLQSLSVTVVPLETPEVLRGLLLLSFHVSHRDPVPTRYWRTAVGESTVAYVVVDSKLLVLGANRKFAEMFPTATPICGRSLLQVAGDRLDETELLRGLESARRKDGYFHGSFPIAGRGPVEGDGLALRVRRLKFGSLGGPKLLVSFEEDTRDFSRA